MLRISLQHFAQHDTAIEGFTCAALLCTKLFPYAPFRNRAKTCDRQNCLSRAARDRKESLNLFWVAAINRDRFSFVITRADDDLQLPVALEFASSQNCEVFH